MGGGRSIRVVTVDGWDTAACGGTHVTNTAEIGPISVLDRSNPGEGVTRVEFAVGPTAIDRHGAVHAAALEASTLVDVGVDGLVDAVAGLVEENDRLESELAAARTELLDARLREFPTTEVDGGTWAIGAVDADDPNALREPASGIVGEDVDALGAVGPGPSPFVVVAAAGDADVDAGDVIGAVTDEFGGGGGGGPTFAQGGGLDADPETVVAWLRDR